MAKYRVKELSYIHDRLVEAEEIVEIDGNMTPGENLEAVKENAKVTAPDPGADFKTKNDKSAKDDK